MIELDEVALRFESEAETVTALDRVTLRIDEGEFVALFGASGSGKTTLLNVIAGLQVPDSGTIAVGGQAVTGMSDTERAVLRLEQVGVVFQDHNLIPEFTAMENVMLPLRARGAARGVAEAAAAAELARVGLGELGRRRPTQLSGGQRQRVGIARALVGGRSVLLADEPTGALDSTNTRTIFAILADLARDGVAVMAATHDPIVGDYADRSITMLDGRIVADRGRAV